MDIYVDVKLFGIRFVCIHKFSQILNFLSMVLSTLSISNLLKTHALLV